MATDVQTWVHQSLEGDQQAFGNLAQSEDLAQVSPSPEEGSALLATDTEESA